MRRLSAREAAVLHWTVLVASCLGWRAVRRSGYGQRIRHVRRKFSRIHAFVTDSADAGFGFYRKQRLTALP
jgi:hypothetical protein